MPSVRAKSLPVPSGTTAKATRPRWSRIAFTARFTVPSPPAATTRPGFRSGRIHRRGELLLTGFDR
jgi:hypothetical protein